MFFIERSTFGPRHLAGTSGTTIPNSYFIELNHGPNKIDTEIINTVKMINAFYILREKLLIANDQLGSSRRKSAWSASENYYELK